MIDIENQVFTIIASRLRAKFGKSFYVSGELNLNPTTFPCAYIEQADNSALTSSRDTASNENHAVVMYEVNVYSNKTSGKKTEAKAIFEVIDETFNDLGFTRQSMLPFQFDNTTKYRVAGRYIAVVDKRERIFRR